MKKELKSILEYLNNLTLDEKVDAINEIKLSLHDISPFKTEPVDCVYGLKIQMYTQMITTLTQ